MGATQSKKRRKDKLKKKRGSVTLDIPRSASMGTLRSSEVTLGSSSCPLCPHCRSSVSWSSDHSLTHSLCLYHAKQGYRGMWDTDTDTSQGRGEVLDKMGFETSCPDCFLPSSSQGCLRLCEISNQDYDEISTMSLNRHLSGKQLVKPVGIVQSKSAEFTDSTHRKQLSQTKENVHPDLCNYIRKKVVESHHPSTATTDTFKRRAPSSDLPEGQRQNVNVVVTSASSTHLAPPPPPPPTATSSADISCDGSSKETKSNLSLLEDEEAIVSRWVKRKKMAQELRNLRMHLQNEEVSKQQTISQTSSSTFTTPLSSCNNNNKVKEEKTIRETFTSTVKTVTNASVTSVFGDDVTDADHHLGDSSRAVRRSNSDSTGRSSSSTTPTRRSVRSKFSRLSNYRYLDNHPVMTRLQNEQNNRLELMERRMEEIRISAMQEAERRKFAEIFPAKNDDSETQKLLREARESLERMKEEKRKKALSHKGQHQQCYQNDALPRPGDTNYHRCQHIDYRPQEDSGEIIPVRVLSSSREVTPVIDSRGQKVVNGSDKANQNKQPFWLKSEWPDINLSQPLTWLWLPFMLFPLVLRMLLSMIINSLSSLPRNGNSANTGCNNFDRNRNLSRQKRKKSC